MYFLDFLSSKGLLYIECFRQLTELHERGLRQIYKQIHAITIIFPTHAVNSSVIRSLIKMPPLRRNRVKMVLTPLPPHPHMMKDL